jgi:DNA polymerase, archaea type
MSTNNQRKYLNSYCQREDVILEYRENGEKKQEVIQNFEWYLVITKNDFEKIKPYLEKLKQSSLCTKYEILENHVKLFTENKNTTFEMDGRQGLIKWLMDNNIQPLEADIYSDKRYCLDNQIEVEENYKILYIDIETDDSAPSIVVGQEQILSFAAVDMFNHVTYYSTSDEKKLLNFLLKTISKHDIIATWNGEKFDIPYIKARMQYHNIKFFQWKSIAHIDMMKRFIHTYRFDSKVQKFSLDYIANHFLGKGKVKTGRKTIDMFRNSPDLLKQYNIQDVILLKELDEKTGCLNMMILQAQWCKTFMSQFYISELLDNYILRIAHQNNIWCPSKRFVKVENAAQYTGGFVLEPIRGVHENVFVFDFKSLYPTLIMTSNIGFDTIDPHGEILNPGTGKRFTNKKDSVIKLTIQGLIGKRKEYKQKKLEMIGDGLNKGPEWERVVSDEIIVKELSNSVYGIMGKQDGRWYSVDVAESITKFGQWSIKFATKFFEDNGFKVIYGDTDSIFVKDFTENELELHKDKVLDRYHQTLEEILKKQFGIIKNYIELEFDKHFKTLLMIDKKTYTGHVINMEGKKTDQVYTRGLDYIKKSSISIAAVAQKKLIDHLLFDNFTVFDCEKFINEIMNRIKIGEIDIKDLIIQIKLNKPIHEYTSRLPHVIVAKEMIAKNGMLESNEIDYIVIDAKNKKYVVPKDYENHFDRSYYWNNRVYPMLERLLEVVYPRNDWKRYHVKEFISINQQILF